LTLFKVWVPFFKSDEILGVIREVFPNPNYIVVHGCSSTNGSWPHVFFSAILPILNLHIIIFLKHKLHLT